MKILFFANTDWYLYNFRRSLIEKMRDDCWDVVLVSPPGKYGRKLEELGFHWIPFAFSTKSTNPLNEMAVISELTSLYRQEQPDLCHHFTIKCVLYGSIAARLSKTTSIINSVTGMGHVFTDGGLRAKLLKPVVRTLYRCVFSLDRSRVIFQNSEDQDYFISNSLVDKNQTRLIRGSGVNIEKFAPPSKQSVDDSRQVSILFASRLIREKGVFELIEASRILKRRKRPAEIVIAGDIYPENPSSLSHKDIEAIKRESGIRVVGHVDDIRPLLVKSDVVVLPSYREGTPRILIEAAAMGKPIVATDIAGCRGLVVDGVNGLLVPVSDGERLANALEKLILDSGIREEMGKAGRHIVLREFDETIVIRKTLDIYREILSIDVT